MFCAIVVPPFLWYGGLFSSSTPFCGPASLFKEADIFAWGRGPGRKSIFVAKIVMLEFAGKGSGCKLILLKK